MTIFKIKTSDAEIFRAYREGQEILKIDHLIQYENEIAIGAPVLLLFGGDGTPWINGLYAIAKVNSMPLEMGYEQAARGGQYYKLEIKIILRLERVFEKIDFIRYPESFDSGVAPSTKGERNQALGIVDDKDFPKIIASICRALLDSQPEYDTQLREIFGDEVINYSLNHSIVYGQLQNEQEETPKSQEQQSESVNRQMILFGAPGTGKSYKIDYNLFKDKNGHLIGKGIKEIPENRKFRTTFHPDYDYAQFVGAYKPQKVQCNDNGLLSEEQLAHKLSESFLKRDNSEIDKTSAIVLFGLQYANSLNGKTISQIVKLSGIGDEEYKKANLSAAVKAQLQFSDVDGKITYSFVPQVFAKAYAAAWKQYFDAGSVSTVENQVYLVIEEINRGNCAQIFGDIFQLLDRVSDGTDKGFSQYSIDADCDFADWLKNKDAGLKSVWNQYKDEVGEGKLRLPPNLNILATMNTSDQSLFPMDSAFKRRFDWEYVPISFDGKDAANYQIDIDGSQYSWQNFVEAVNDKILDLTESEDKQLGEFFIKPDSGNVISKERFLGKVMFYLWNEVCKDEHKNGSFFRVKNDGKEEFFTFQDLYKKKDLLKLFMDELLKKE